MVVMVGKEDSERVENMEAVAEMEARAMVVAQPVVVDAVVLELVMAVVAIPEWPGPRVVVLMEGMAAAEQVKEMVAVVLMVRPITEGNAGPCPMQGREERLLAPNRARPVRGRLSPFLVDPLIEHTAHGTQSAHIRVYSGSKRSYRYIQAFLSRRFTAVGRRPEQHLHCCGFLVCGEGRNLAAEI